MQTSPPPCEVIVLTALPVEYKAVIRHLQHVQEIVHDQGMIYEWGSFTGQHRTWRVAVAEIGMGGPTAAAETERAIHFFHAQIALFVGIAGGLKDVHLGDVVAATKIYAYESGKAGPTFAPRPEVRLASYALVARARHEAHSDEWLAHLDGSCPGPAPQIHIGALAAGEKVLASTRSSVYHQLKATYGDALAVEMEGHGFLHTVHINPAVQGLVIRGISDLIDDKTATDAAGAQSVAAQHAAAFAFQVLAKFTFPPQDDQQSLVQLVHWNIPLARNSFFTGRHQELEQLYRQLQQSNTVAIGQTHAISGLGGIGKTQLAVEYAYRYREKYRSIFWVLADSRETLNTAYSNLAKLLNLPGKDQPEQHQIVTAVKDWLEKNQGWLLIFDNADDPSLLTDFLPTLFSGHILLTTRASALGELAETIALPKLPEDESISFLLHRSGISKKLQPGTQIAPREKETAREIVLELDGLPLALDQAGAYIEETSCGLQGYLKSFREERKALLATRGGVRNLHPDPVATTWRMAFERVEKANPAAADLLRLCAFLAPEEIPEQLITLGEVELTGPLKKLARSSNKLNNAIRELQKYSLIARDALAQTLTIHRLVQAILRDHMPKNTAYAWAVRTMRIMYRVFPWPTVENWNFCQQLLPHARECAALITQWEITMIEGAFLLYNMSSYLDDRGIYNEAEVYCKRVLEIESKLFGQGNVLTANTLNNLGMVYYNQGKYEKAKELHQQALAIRLKVLDENDPEIARSLNNLANISDDQGDYQKAEQLYTQTLAIRYKVLGEEHPDTLTSLNNLADVFLNRGKYEEAEKRYRQALTIRKRILREDHPDIAVSLNSLANAYQHLGRFKEAEILLQQAVAIDQRVLGKEHIATAITLTNLAYVYANLHQYEEAKILFQQALAIYSKEQSEHPAQAKCLNGLALVYLHQEDYEQAESLLYQALTLQSKMLSADHPDTAETLQNLGALYYQQQRNSEALPLFEQALAISRQRKGEEHPDTQALLEIYKDILQLSQNGND